MKKFSIKALCALVVVAACAGGSQLAIAPDLHSQVAVVQGSNGSDWQGYAAPSAAYDDGTGWLCATWMDHSLFNRDEGRFADTDFFGFEFEVNEGGVWKSVGAAPNVGGSMTGCHDLSAWEDGTYRLRVTAKAVHGTPAAATTHLTNAWEGSVMVGQAHSPAGG